MSTNAHWTVPVWTVGERLRKARETRGLEQGQFADLIGVSKATVSNYERDLYKPKVVVLRAWSMATGVPVEWLETGSEPTGPDGPGGPMWAPWDSNPQPTDYGHLSMVA